MTTDDSLDLYHEVLLQENAHPQHRGQLEHPDAEAEHHNASCGDRVRVTLQLQPDATSGQVEITNLLWQGEGCAVSQAAMSVLATELIGSSTARALSLTQSELENLLGLSQVSLGRVKCLMLGLRSVQQALREYDVT